MILALHKSIQQKGSIRKIILFTFFMAIISSCASTTGVPEHKTNLSYGMIKSRVKKGQTTQEEILRIFGSPNIVTKNKAGLEVWTYSKQSSQAKSGSMYGSLLIIGGDSAYSNTSTDSFDFILTFDENDIVKDFSVVSSKF